jgi:hypothetical protein
MPYYKLDTNGTILLTKNLPVSSDSDLVVDSNDHIRIVWYGVAKLNNISHATDYGMFYMKLDNNGRVLIDNKRIEKVYGTYEIYARMDSNETLIVAHKYGFVRIDTNGTVLQSGWYIGGRYDNFAMDSRDNIYGVYIGVDSTSDGSHYNNQSSIYFKKRDAQGNLIANKTIPTNITVNKTWSIIAIDHSEDLHVLSYEYVWNWSIIEPSNYTGYYTKLDTDGNVLINPKQLSGVLGKRGRVRMTVDRNNDIIVGKLIEVWEDHTFVRWDYYYAKLDNNGDTIISPMKIFSDEWG